jgi:hypothetical protein
MKKTQDFYNTNQDNLDYSKYALLHQTFGEIVTLKLDENTLKLGNIWGLWTFPVSYWKSKKDQPKGELGFTMWDHCNAYDVVLIQAKETVIEIYEVIQSIKD